MSDNESESMMEMDQQQEEMKNEQQPNDNGIKQEGGAVPPAQPNPLHIRLVSDPKLRFILELEFVELLASPQYLQFLAQSRYLVDPAFLNYLTYLQYWHRPEYIKFLSHPHCLYFLDLLQTPLFRSQLLNPTYVNLLHEQQFFHWTSGRYNRYMEAEQQREERKRAENERKEEEEKQKIDQAEEIVQ